MDQELHIIAEEKSFYEKLANRAIKNFKKRSINAYFKQDRHQACSFVMELIPEGVTVGTADSMTIRQVGVIEAIKDRGKNLIIDPFVLNDDGTPAVSSEEKDSLMHKVLLSDIYIIGTNAVTMDGKLVNIDGRGNRVAPMIYGPKKVIFVVGANKIVKNVEEAIKRIKEVCAPKNALRHGMKHHKSQFLDLPCAKTGVCANCSHPWRICNYTTIIEGAMPFRKDCFHVLIVGESLGI